MKIIDTHLHFWDLNKFSLPWLEGIDVLKRNFLLEDYLQATINHSVEKMIYMEVDVDKQQKHEEANYIAKLIQAQDNPLQGAVCSGILGETNFTKTLEYYKKYPEIKGIRHVLHVPTYPQGYCLSKDFLDDLKKLFAADLIFDICIRPNELSDAVKMVDYCPEGVFILDHCGNPNPLLLAGEIAQPEKNLDDIFWHDKNDWIEQIAKLGKRSNVICKISGIIARANPLNFKANHLKAVVDHCLDSFGEDRVIFGGDWPVCELTLGLGTWITSLKEILSERSQSIQNKLFYENAKRIYKI